MRRLLLLRHAKSSWQVDEQDDFDRPLNGRGRKAAPIMGDFMHRNDLSPDLILCSTALRARETLALALPFFRGEATIQLEDRLYLASAAKMLERLRNTAGQYKQVMIIAHNPGLQDLTQMLAADGPDDALVTVESKFPTAALAQIDFEVDDWSSLERESGTLTRFITPRALSSN